MLHFPRGLSSKVLSVLQETLLSFQIGQGTASQTSWIPGLPTQSLRTLCHH